MKVLFFQNEREPYYSVHTLFNIIRSHLPATIQQKVIHFSLNGLSKIKKTQNILAVTKVEKGDINHIVDDINYATFFLKKEKTILTIHDLMRLNVSSGIRKSIFVWFWLKLPISRAVMITSVSQTTKNEILKYVHCSPDKIRVIHNCISPAFKPVKKEFNKQRPVLLQVGVRENKNFHRVIMAIEGIPCKLKIIGEPLEDTLYLLKKCGIDFDYKSAISEAEVVRHYIECDVLVFASLYEGFGLPIIEANTVERVVVASNVLSEAANDAACFVDPLDIASIRAGILRVIEDSGYRESLIEAGRRNRERFNAQYISNQYAELYQEIYLKNSLKEKTANQGVSLLN
jgi:glycosyltransferase involved in cell wall biosynthesis